MVLSGEAEQKIQPARPRRRPTPTRAWGHCLPSLCDGVWTNGGALFLTSPVVLRASACVSGGQTEESHQARSPCWPTSEPRWKLCPCPAKPASLSCRPPSVF
ncbi:mCG148307 [Mus musculus]|uniref:Uncharacterized protein n=1 Tax=Mus musculus TaxID=10090 RepID=Q8C950_MOUSE|nr:mCG148307 [Mus musculus]BAC31415.1 unnamed protein product [Mus musculus]